MSIDVELVIEDERWSDLIDPESLVSAICEKLSIRCRVEIANSFEASILFCSDERMRELNRSWMKKDYPTNVLSFPSAQHPHSSYLGDIAIAFETIVAEAKAEGKAPLNHTAHMVVHGFLHLLGYDHQTDDEATRMEGLETLLLQDLGIPDPWARERGEEI